MGKTTAGQEQGERSKYRGPREGRILINVSFGIGGYICEQSEDLGIPPSTIARMLIVEAVKARGFTVKELEEKYPLNLPPDRRLREVREAEAAAADAV